MSPARRRMSNIAALVALAMACALLVPVPAAATDSAWRRVTVDRRAPNASDSNPGTTTAPLKTISRALVMALAHNRAGHPTRVTVRRGVYRESLRLPRADGRTTAAFVLEGAPGARVIVTGSDVWRGWKRTAGGTYTSAWPHRWGLAPLPDGGWADYFADKGVSAVARRREIVWINGKPLRQVLNIADIPAGAFAVDESAGRIVIRPASGVDMRAATVEVSVRDRLLDVEGWSNVTVRRMEFRNAATPLEQAAVRFLGGRNVKITDSRVVWNNWTGLALQYVEGAVVRRVSTSNNGVVGFSAYKVTNLKLARVDNSYNNTWRGPWSNYYGWSTGAKLYRVHNVDVNRWYAVGNQANGLWFDTDVADATIRNSFMARNRKRGVFLEAIQGPVTAVNNTVCNNGEYGVVDGKADGVTLQGNRIFGNAEAQIVFSGERGGRSMTDFRSGREMVIRSKNWRLEDNVIAGKDSTRLVGNHLDTTDWSTVRSSLRLSGNRWHHPSDPRPFTLPGEIATFGQWRNATGEVQAQFSESYPRELKCRARRPKPRLG